MPAFRYHQFQVVGRHLPTEADASPKVYRMKLWATDSVRAKSKFWYFMSMLKKVKKANGQIIACNEIFERKPTTVKNFGIWIRYQSRTGEHNMYKEFRDVTLNGAVDQMYAEMASRHRSRASQIQIVKTATVPSNQCKRVAVTMMHNKDISFPVQQKIVRPISKSLKTTFKYKRPSACMM